MRAARRARWWLRACILDRDKFPRGIDDSKNLPIDKREAIYAKLVKCSAWGVGIATVEEIDQINIYWARMLAMTRAVEALGLEPAWVLVDGNACPQVAAAVEGDRRRRRQVPLDRRRLDHRQGHPRPHHGRLCARISGLRLGDEPRLSARRIIAARSTTLGPTPLHRRSFAPVARQIERAAAQPELRFRNRGSEFFGVTPTSG